MNYLMAYNYHRRVNVTRYNPTHGSVKGLEIASAALAYYCTHTGKIYIKNQAIRVETMNNNPVCPLNLR